MNTKLPLNSSSHLVGLSRTIGRFIAKTKANMRLFSAAALTVGAAALAPMAASAQSAILWGPATTISGSADVTNSGTAVYAYAGAATTNNGVAFTAVSGTTWGHVSLSGGGFSGYAGNAFAFNGGTFATLSNAYTKVIASGAYGGDATGVVTLNGLNPGEQYLVQIWLNDSRNNATTEQRTETIAGTSVTLKYNSTGVAGGVGQYAVGIFAATSTNETFLLSPNPTTGSGQLNAISVRDVGSAIKTWVGTSGTSWGTATDWNPASAPTIPGDSVLFDAASTANLATV
ncbi:MAG: hypothetical protein HKL95_00805, partial [Phycisphaerae bacterium]|nr:hypothetical protein [Phycisphaerae bacterium]